MKSLFPSPSKTLIKKQIDSIIERINIKSDGEEEDFNMHFEPTSTSKADFKLKENIQLGEANRIKTLSTEAFRETNFSKIIKEEINLFEASYTGSPLKSYIF